jgi:hypothetical protein
MTAETQAEARMAARLEAEEPTQEALDDIRADAGFRAGLR